MLLLESPYRVKNDEKINLLLMLLIMILMDMKSITVIYLLIWFQLLGLFHSQQKKMKTCVRK